MTLIESIFRLFAFVTLMSTPSANGVLNEKESIIAGATLGPVLMRWGLDYIVRVMALFGVGLMFEYSLGNQLYESYLVDYVLLLIAALGGIHWLVYVLLLIVGSYSNFTFTVYRVFRNLCFAPIPGLFLLIPLNIWEYFHGMEPYESGLALLLYKAVTAGVLIMGIAEVFVRKGRPTGFIHNES